MKYLTITLLLLLVGCGTTRTDLRSLVLIPPPGTDRSSVEAVYGKPSAEITSEPSYISKLPVPKNDWRPVDPPRYEYILLPELAKLIVVYSSGRVQSAKLWQFRYASAGRPGVKTGSEEWQRYKEMDVRAARYQARDRESIRQKFAGSLVNAPWNQRKLEQRNEGSVEPN